MSSCRARFLLCVLVCIPHFLWHGSSRSIVSNAGGGNARTELIVLGTVPSICRRCSVSEGLRELYMMCDRWSEWS